jgi:hypothetical protein
MSLDTRGHILMSSVKWLLHCLVIAIITLRRDLHHAVRHCIWICYDTVHCIYSGCDGSHIPCNEPEPSTAPFDACVHLRACTATVEEIATQIIYRSMKWSAWHLDVFVWESLCWCWWWLQWWSSAQGHLCYDLQLRIVHWFKVTYPTGLFFFFFFCFSFWL